MRRTVPCSLRSRRRPRARAWRLVAATLCATLAYAAPAENSAAAAQPKVKREGGQAELTFGGSLCVPGVASCSASPDVVEDTNVFGSTDPSWGAGFTIGYRPHRAFLFGAAYNVGFFRPNYRSSEPIDADMFAIYKRAYQSSVFGVLRGILPLWRFDLGLELAPGWSRQSFDVVDGRLQVKDENSELIPGIRKVFSQGFALKTAPVIDIYLTRQLFIGAKIDFIWNLHGEVCYRYDGGATKKCFGRQATNQASVHQMIVGAHIGGTF